MEQRRRPYDATPERVAVSVEIDGDDLRAEGGTVTGLTAILGTLPGEAKVWFEGRDEYGDPSGYLSVCWDEAATDDDRAAAEYERRRDAQLRRQRKAMERWEAQHAPG